MTDLEYLERAESLLAQVEQQCDAINERTSADIDCQRAGGMLTLAFGARGQIVISLQKPLHEMWLAARTGGYHYRFDGNAWRDTKTGEEFHARLSCAASEHADMALGFEPAAQTRATPKPLSLETAVDRLFPSRRPHGY